MNISKQLKRWREKRGLSIKEISEEVKVPESTYRGYEYGSKLPAYLVPKICGVLSIRYEDFFSPIQENQKTFSNEDVLYSLYLMENCLKEIRLYINRTKQKK